MPPESQPAILESLKVARPCHESWEKMSGDERSRFCAQCSLKVHDLSVLTPKEAVSLVEKTGYDLCVRYEKNADGGIRFRPTRKWGASLKQGASLLLASVLVLFGFQATLRAKDTQQCDKDKKASQPAPSVTMGVPLMVPEPTPPPTPAPMGKIIPPEHYKMGRMIKPKA